MLIAQVKDGLGLALSEFLALAADVARQLRAPSIDPDVAAGWGSYASEQGEIFYHNALTGATSWTMPSALAIGMVQEVAPVSALW